jgi:hypothetical protein
MICFRALFLSLLEYFASTRLPLLDPFSFLWTDLRFSNEDMWTVASALVSIRTHPVCGAAAR